MLLDLFVWWRRPNHHINLDRGDHPYEFDFV